MANAGWERFSRRWLMHSEALALLGYPYEHPYREQCRQALHGLVVEEGERAWVSRAHRPYGIPSWRPSPYRKIPMQIKSPYEGS